MRVARGALLLTVAWCALRPPAAEAAERPLTLAEAQRLAGEAPSGRAVDLEVQRARAEVRGAGLWSNPDASLSQESAGSSFDHFAAVSLTLPWSGRLSLERSAAQSAADAAERRGRQARLELRTGVREAFLDLLAAQARVAATQEGAARLDDLVRILRAREAEGESSGFDRQRGERERAEVEADLLDARALLARSRAALAGLVAVPSEDLVAQGTLDAVVALPSLEEAQAQAARASAVEAAGFDVDAQDRLARAAGRRVIPEPTLTAGTKRSDAGKGAQVGFSFSLPLFDRGQAAKAVAEAEASLLRTRRELLVRASVAGAEGALFEVRARRQAESAYAAGANAEDLIRIAQAAYSEGEMRLLELLDAYRTTLAVRLRQIDLHAEARRAEIRLDQATGVERAP